MQTSCSLFVRIAVVTISLLTLTVAHAAPAVAVSNAWIRSTVPAQTATGAFMDIISAAPAMLVGATSTVADVEIHHMKIDNGIMKMRPVKALPLPAKTPVKLSAGNYHMMLSNLKKPLKKGDVVALTLIIESPDRKKSSIKIDVPVRDATP